jgi:hypothetical protein
MDGFLSWISATLKALLLPLFLGEAHLSCSRDSGKARENRILVDELSKME